MAWILDSFSDGTKAVIAGIIAAVGMRIFIQNGTLADALTNHNAFITTLIVACVMISGILLIVVVDSIKKSAEQDDFEKPVESDLVGVNLQNATISGKNLECVNLECSKMQGIDLSETKMNNANLSGARLEHADLRGADLTNANLRGANLTGAKFKNTTVKGAEFKGATLPSTSNLKNDFDKANGVEEAY